MSSVDPSAGATEVSRIGRLDTLESKHALRRRLPLLILALLVAIAGSFAWMAYREVVQELRTSGGERVAGAASQLAALLAQSAATRVAEARRLAVDPDVRRVVMEGAVPDVQALPGTLSYLSRNPQATLCFYDSAGRLLGEQHGPERSPDALFGCDPAAAAAQGIRPMRMSGDHAWFQTSATIAVDDSGAAPLGSLTVQRSMGTAAAADLIQRLIGSGAAIRLGNASGSTWTDFSKQIPAPPVTGPGTPASYRNAEGDLRLGAAVPIAGTPWLLWAEMSEGTLLQPAGSLLRRMVPITLVLTAIGVLAVYAVSLRVTRPLEYLTHAAEAMAAGDYSRRVTVNRRDEIGRLGTAFNTMARRVAAAHDDLEARVAARTQELEDARHDLQQRAAELATANKELESFSYSVSHDLRAPLRSIDGFAQALVEDCADSLDDTGRAYLARIRAAAQRMGALIDDLLALSRVTRLELAATDVNLSALAREIAARLQEQEPDRRVEWRIAGDVMGRGDPRLLRVLLENLLENAWKFTARQPEAAIEFCAVAGARSPTTYLVRDNGAGFDMAHAAKLFGPFQRLHSALEFPGTGIGLATVDRIVRRHGGRAWADAAVGRGATFSFTLDSQPSA